jgi:hypothetical protein
MRTLRAVIVATTAIFLALAVDGATPPFQAWFTQRQIVQDRDLRQFEDGGDFSEEHSPDFSASDIPRLSVLRQFIWSRWKQKKLSYVRLWLSGGDNAVAFHWFIEPRKNGRWHIARREVNHGGNIPPRQTLSSGPEIISVSWAKRKKTDFWRGDYVLVFRGKSGKEVYRL